MREDYKPKNVNILNSNYEFIEDIFHEERLDSFTESLNLILSVVRLHMREEFKRNITVMRENHNKTKRRE